MGSPLRASIFFVMTAPSRQGEMTMLQISETTIGNERHA